jgi:hypothetical protein
MSRPVRSLSLIWSEYNHRWSGIIVVPPNQVNLLERLLSPCIQQFLKSMRDIRMRVEATATAVTIVFLFGATTSIRANDLAPAIDPVTQQSGIDESELHIDWEHLLTQTLTFSVIQHAFRYSTENGTRNPGEPFFRGYAKALEGMHGWNDGDPFIVNYVGHPLQGAVAARIWMQNDPKYKDVEIGGDPRYWKSRFRATAFAWVQSVQFEIGPFSEASIGNIQKRWPEQGFVDHVVTPVVGLGWVLAEDAIDKYLVRRLEPNHRNLAVFLRGGLMPSASFANVMAGKYPWHRLNRSNYPWRYASPSLVPRTPKPKSAPEVPSDVAIFELAVIANAQLPRGRDNPCAGGGANPAVRFTRTFQLAIDIGGCSIIGLGTNKSGDLLQYMAGPRWTPFPTSRFSPYLQVLAGGQKITQQQVLPDVEQAVIAERKKEGKTPSGPDTEAYVIPWSLNRFAWKAGAGVDFRVTRAFAIRLASLDYVMTHTILQDEKAYGNGFHLTSGVILRMGTW